MFYAVGGGVVARSYELIAGGSVEVESGCGVYKQFLEGCGRVAEIDRDCEFL